MGRVHVLFMFTQVEWYFENIKQMHLSFPSNHVPCSLHIITAGPFPQEEEHGTRESTEEGGGDRERLPPIPKRQRREQPCRPHLWEMAAGLTSSGLTLKMR